MSNIFDALRKRDAAAQSRPGSSRATIEPDSRAVITSGKGLSFRAAREVASLRERIELELPRNGRRVVAVAGSIVGEGASSVALEMARAMAHEGGAKTILVDLDLARTGRSLTQAIRGGGALSGIVDVAAGVDLERCVLATDEPSLHFLPSGREPVRALEVLPPERLRVIVDDLAKTYRTVILDLPSILEHPEAPALATAADGVVLVARANRTRREVAQRALLLLEGAHCRTLGVVLNQRKYPIPDFLYRRL